MSDTTLAERLGYGAQDRLLILNCDDLGVSHAGNVGIFRAMTYGVATNATLMVPGAWSREAVEMCKGKAIGVHLTLTAEYQGMRWRGLTRGKSLHDPDGYLPSGSQAALQRLEAEEVRAECRAQITTALAWGVDVTHIDAHMGVIQHRSDLFDVYLDLAAEFRVPISIFYPKHLRSFAFPAHERARARGILFNDHVLFTWPRPSRDVFFEALPQLAPGVTETMAHPVVDGEELRAIDRDNADLRAHDLGCLTDPALIALLDDQNIRRVSYRDLREAQRAGA